MGQRANYIIKHHDTLRVHYNNWRANCIAADVYLGEKRFLQFVEACQLNEELMNEPWIEGCVIIDKDTRQLYFWTWELSIETSITEYYLSALAKKWQGWSVHLLKNRMYDVEKILGIDYISRQELPELNKRSTEEILNDTVDEWITATVILKDGDYLLVTKTGNLSTEIIVSYGQGIVSLLREKPTYELPNEDDETTYECVIIDTAGRKLFINESIFGLWEQSKSLWEGYECTMGDFGYIELLGLAGIDASHLRMKQDKVVEEFHSIIKQENSFDPFEMAEKLREEHGDIQFNPDFFDTVKPQKTLFQKLKMGVRKILGR